MTTAYQISCGKCKLRVESLENHTVGSQVAEGHAENSLRAIIYPDYIRVRSLKSHDMKNQKWPGVPTAWGDETHAQTVCNRRSSVFRARRADFFLDEVRELSRQTMEN